MNSRNDPDVSLVPAHNLEQYHSLVRSALEQVPSLLRKNLRPRAWRSLNHALGAMEPLHRLDLVQGIEHGLISRSANVRMRALILLGRILPMVHPRDLLERAILLEERVLQDKDDAVATLAAQQLAMHPHLFGGRELHALLLAYVSHTSALTPYRETLMRTCVLGPILFSAKGRHREIAQDLEQRMTNRNKAVRIKATAMLKQLLAQEYFELQDQLEIFPRLILKAPLTFLKGDDRRRIADLATSIALRCQAQGRMDDLLRQIEGWSVEESAERRYRSLDTLNSLFGLLSQEQRIAAARTRVLPMVFDPNASVRSLAMSSFYEMAGLLSQQEILAVMMAAARGTVGVA